jgi:hypothetical protein
MLFEPYTRERMLQRLDAEFHTVWQRSTGHSPASHSQPTKFARILALVGWIVLLPATLSTAQSTPPAAAPNAGVSQSKTAKPSATQPPAHHAVHHHHHAKPAAEVVPPAPVVPPPPPRPAEQPANPASIQFNNGVLTIHAQNSSLVNTLTQIQHMTGLVIDGLSHDQRMYGQYGPGNISATLSALLDGSGYDFVIVGGGGGLAAPRLILSTPGSVGAPAVAPPPVVNNPDNPPPDTADQPDQPDQPDQTDPTAPPEAKSPQEIFDELRKMHPQ